MSLSIDVPLSTVSASDAELGETNCARRADDGTPSRVPITSTTVPAIWNPQQRLRPAAARVP